jgi:hypothetical protein
LKNEPDYWEQGPESYREMIENLGSIHPRLAGDRNELSPEVVDLTGSDLLLQVIFLYQR